VCGRKIKRLRRKSFSGGKNATYFSPCKKCSHCYSYLFAIYSSLGTARGKNILSPVCNSAVKVNKKYSFSADRAAQLIE